MLKNITIGQYFPGNSAVHRLDARMKLILTIALLVDVFISDGFLGFALIFAFVSTGMGLLASAVTKSQIAALFIAMVGTILPAIQFSGLINPVSSLEGGGRLIGEVYPATYMIIISRGIFSKGLSLVDLSGAFWCMLASVPLILGVAILLLKKQER